MNMLGAVKMGFALGVPASPAVLARIREGVLVHRTRLANIKRIVTGVLRRPDGFANARIRLTGEAQSGPFDLLRATVRDHRVVDFRPFQGAGGTGFTNFVYFFLGEPDEAQVAAQNYGGEGEFVTIRIRGADLLSDPSRAVFYRRGLFWEADKAVIVKGGYEGPAKVPLPVNLNAPFC